MEPQIIDYYNEYPHMMKVIEKLNLEYDELYSENQSLKKEIERLRNIYEPNPDLNRLIDFCVRTGGKHYDIAKVFHCIYKNEFKCTSLKKNKWYYKSGSEWKECDSELGKHGIQVRIKLSEMRNIYENKLKEYEERFTILTESDIDDNEHHSEIFRLIDMLENCEKIINKFKGKHFYSYLLRELAELFYVGD
jgi:hypothetical protein